MFGKTNILNFSKNTNILKISSAINDCMNYSSSFLYANVPAPAYAAMEPRQYRPKDGMSG